MEDVNARAKKVFGDEGIPALITRTNFAKLLGVSRPTLSKMIKAGSVCLEGKYIPSREYYRLVLVKNAREAGVSESDIRHIEASIS